jgi:long chain fatty acid CoA FadD26
MTAGARAAKAAPDDVATVRVLPALLSDRARTQPDAVAYTYLHDGEEPVDRLTYGQLDRDARSRASALRGLGLAGEPVVLLYDTGTEFVRALLGCMCAGAAAIPVQVPSRRQGVLRMRRIMDDAGARVVLTSGDVRARLLGAFGALPEVAGLAFVDTTAVPDDAGRWAGGPQPDDVALLQYTSGSTGHPKGVVVTHRNLWHNTADILTQWPVEARGAIVSWLPLFHDLGLLFGAVLPVRAGIPAYLMSPAAFVRRPLRWLEAISRFRATHVAAPDFAFRLCVAAAAEGARIGPLDLSSWRVAVNGAEPVRWDTIERFAETFRPYGFGPTVPAPAYGLAEATLHVTGTRSGAAPTALSVAAGDLRAGRAVPVPSGTPGALRVVSCGTAVAGTEVRIADPVTRRPVRAREVGEVWVCGPGVARGYWRREPESREVFGARLAGEESAGPFLRTGDLGFLHDGELYLTGRYRDLMVRDGRNHHPNDLEYTVENSHPLLRPSCAAAFSVDDGERERFVIAVEVDRRVLGTAPAGDLADRVAGAVEAEHGLRIDHVVLIRRGTLAKTTSGKVQRHAMRQRYLDGTLQVVASAVAAD